MAWFLGALMKLHQNVTCMEGNLVICGLGVCGRGGMEAGQSGSVFGEL